MIDIISNKKSKLLYQRGDQKMEGVVDLRRFSDKKIKFEIEPAIQAAQKDPENPMVSLKTKQGTRFISIKSFFLFIFLAFLASGAIFSLSYIQKIVEQKAKVLGAGARAYDYLKLAGESAANSDFKDTINNFDSATLNFSNADKLTNELGLGIAKILRDLPIETPVSTAQNLTEAGINISKAGKNITELLAELASAAKNNFSTDSFGDFQTKINDIALDLKGAKKNIAGINPDYIPENMREKIKLAQNQLPGLADNFENLSKDLPVISEILSDAHPQKYLILFENNSEIRATGGFIGSYGILDTENGKIKSLTIDGIFDPDGQLNEKVIPPMPIQKISAAWSMHDANWFADFPTSARKIALFYEKTGGPTVDGVIAITPEVLKKILKITGPIEMPEYNIAVDENNFLDKTQIQVEELYDKKANKPKQFLADLAPKIISVFFNGEDRLAEENIQKHLSLLNAMEESLKEKHIILYHRDPDIESMILKRGWGGQILNSSGDYLSIVNSNINGYKTDAVIDEQIIHLAEISDDGSITDTVKITKTHTGGDSEYDWYNRVNSDYMRVYVPLGSILLEAKGHTVQSYEPPIDYADFKTDPDVAKIEKTMKIDFKSGTQIFEESGKTVFGNWVYVSPGEKVEVTYKYKLPYKIDFDGFTKPADKYSILVQKQLGSAGSKFSGSIKLPAGWSAVWNSKELQKKSANESTIDTSLKTDRIYGTVFARNTDEEQ